jgi:hypothetical protein
MMFIILGIHTTYTVHSWPKEPPCNSLSPLYHITFLSVSTAVLLPAKLHSVHLTVKMVTTSVTLPNIWQQYLSQSLSAQQYLSQSLSAQQYLSQSLSEVPVTVTVSTAVPITQSLSAQLDSELLTAVVVLQTYPGHMDSSHCFGMM